MGLNLSANIQDEIQVVWGGVLPVENLWLLSPRNSTVEGFCKEYKTNTDVLANVGGSQVLCLSKCAGSTRHSG